MLIDPTVPARALLEGLEQFGGNGPVATLLASAWHERNAYVLSQLYGAPVWSSQAGPGECEGAPDHFFEDGDRLPGGLRAVQIADWFAGEAAFLLDAGAAGPGLFTGDAIEGPMPWTRWRVSLQLYDDPSRERYGEAFGRVLDQRFEVVFPGHGGPIRDDPHGAMAELLTGGGLAYTDDPAAQMPARHCLRQS